MLVPETMRWCLIGLLLVAGPGFAAEYVGRSSCAECHVEAVRAWQGSHHDLAMQPATAETVLGDFDDAAFEHRGVRSRFYRRDDGFFVETEGPDGETREYRLAYTFGADPLQQYLARFPDGRYQALSVAWDTRPVEAGGQRWFHLYPEETIPPGDVLHWTAPAHNWNFACAECHSTDLRKNYDPVTDRYDTQWAEIDVACEACHGPGSDHVAAAERAAAGESEDYPADHGLLVAFDGPGDWRFATGLNSAFLATTGSGASEVEACGRCHARRAQLSADYPFGRPLSDTHRVQLLNQSMYFPDGQIQDEVYVYGSFRQSLMYAKGVTCSDCHDPHSLRLRAEGNQVCARCHLPDRFDSSKHHFHPRESEAGQCVACHMPERTYMVVDPRRDHSMRIPRPDLSVDLGVPNACTGCHQDRTDDWAADQVRAWYGRNAGPGHQRFTRTLQAARQGAPEAGRLLTELILDRESPAIVRATALEALSDYLGPEALPAVQAGLAAEDPLIRRGATQAVAGVGAGPRWRLLSPLLDDPVKAVRIEAASALSDIPLQDLDPTQAERLGRGLAEYQASERFNADRVEHWVNLAGFHARRGDMASAEAAYAEGERRDSRYPPLYINRADMYRAADRDEEAGTVLETGLSQMPDDGALHHAHGLWLIRAQRPEDGLAALARAFELTPDAPRFGYVYGVALNSMEQTVRATEVWRSVLAQRPYDRDTLYALALALRDRGQPMQALVYARRLARLLPGDAGVTRLVDELEGDGSG
jgi:predicted CXXCH cytochrome family protein